MSCGCQRRVRGGSPACLVTFGSLFLVAVAAVGLLEAGVGASSVPTPVSKVAQASRLDDNVLLQHNLLLHHRLGSQGAELFDIGRDWEALADGALTAGRAVADDLCAFGALSSHGCRHVVTRLDQAEEDSGPLVVPAPLILPTQLRLFQDFAMLGRPGASASAEGLALFPPRKPLRALLSWQASLLLCIYGLIYLAIAGSITYYMTTEVTKGTRKVSVDTETTVTVEDMLWKESAVRWFMNSWATAWTSRWGHSLDAAMTKIRPDELPSSISNDKHPSKCSLHFDKLWEKEVECKGSAEARLFPVILRFCGTWRLLYGTVLFLCKTVAKDLYVVVLLELALKFFRWLQSHNIQHPLEPVPLPPMIGAAVVFFSLHPLSIIFFHMLHARIMRDLEQEVCGGLGVAVYRKAMRLPISSAAEEQGKEKQGAPDLKQLIINDVCGNIWNSYHNLNDATYCVLQLAVMLLLLWRHVRTSALLVVAGVWPIAMVLGWSSRRIGESMGIIMFVEDIRNRRLQEIFFAIRTAKCNSWEDSIEKSIGEIRAHQLDALRTFLGRQMTMAALLAVSPKFLAVLTLASYLLFYGALDVSAIFVIIQIVNVIRGSTDGFTRCLTALITVSISIERIETFLQLEEAPLCRKEPPNYLKLWSSKESRASMSLQVHGSFQWTHSGDTKLHDLHLDVPRGSLVAVCGEVGCGKSTLLQAVLGELYPVRPLDSCISRPDKVAYCPQNPVIHEGTLRENVLFGAEMEEDRYAQAIDAAALAKDLESLPEGDGVPIGARGIALSGGQKVRVQLARAAYCQHAELMLLDDPFASVDAPTGDRIFDSLLLGPLSAGRTRIVALQPDRQRLARCDHVLVLSKGRVVAQGTPQEVMASQHFRCLLRSKASAGGAMAPEDGEPERTACEPVPAEGRPAVESGGPPPPKQQSVVLREEEEEQGRPALQHVREYFTRGGFLNVFMLAACLLSCEVCNLLGNLVLARWANRQAAHGISSGWFYVLGYVGCAAGIAVATCLSWLFVRIFTMSISTTFHQDIIRALLQAPVDRFFDKHPVGRIMNRMTNDMRTVDRSLLFTAAYLFIIVGQLCVPVAYVHKAMPFYFTLWVIPTYYIIGMLWFRYWNTMVPMAYGRMVCISSVMNQIADAHENSIIVRAYNDEGRATLIYARSCADALKMTVSGSILEGWFMCRVEVLWNFCTTFVMLFAVVNPGIIGVGTLGLCLTNMMLVQNNFITLCGGASGLMSEFISFVRLYQYLDIPQERPAEVAGDERFRSLVVSCPRAEVGKLKITRDHGTLRVCRDPEGGHPVALLHASTDSTCLVPTKRPREVLQDLCPNCGELEVITADHCVTSVNGMHGSAEVLAEELCGGSGKQVILDIRSSWLAYGAHVKIQNLTVGYADMPKQVLQDVNLAFQARQKVGIVGPTGCGKSTLLLTLLRILEPRLGRILISGIDTLDIGTRALRSALGLVAQDPVLFSGTLRCNLDPDGTYADEQIARALERVQMKGFMEGLPDKLQHAVAEGGENISFGQRQLVCLARLVLRRPALLLLDEATSSIDPRTQEIVTGVLHRDFAGSTILAVAHRIETVEDYDSVVVLEEGRVAEVGPPRVLAERKGGLFAGMLAARRGQCC